MSAPITNIPFSNPLYRNHNFYRRYGKRALDFTGALFGLICLFPVLAILAILLAIVQRTSPFFLQKRIGHGLKPFHIIKFKTMKDTRDKEGNLLPDEERTTVLGSLLRSTSLDELPELINVLLGDMSFIGPRPWIPDQMAIFTPSTRKKRMSLRPGITGLAQVNEIDMSTPELLAETDARMLRSLNSAAYFRYIFMTVAGKGAGDRVRS